MQRNESLKFGEMRPNAVSEVEQWNRHDESQIDDLLIPWWRLEGGMHVRRADWSEIHQTPEFVTLRKTVEGFGHEIRNDRDYSS
jgi:hypothetical protein